MTSTDDDAPPAEGLPSCGHAGVIRGCSACEEYLADWVREMGRSAESGVDAMS